MFKSCKYCGKIVDEHHRCTMKPQYKKNNVDIYKFRNSKAWRDKREEIKDRDKRLCRVCYMNHRFIYNDIEAHHIIPLVENFDLKLDNNNIISLCRTCHEEAEKGKISREMLKKCIPPTFDKE